MKVTSSKVVLSVEVRVALPRDVAARVTLGRHLASPSVHSAVLVGNLPSGSRCVTGGAGLCTSDVGTVLVADAPARVV